MKTLTFKIVTPDGTTYDDAVEQVTLPTKTGQITVLPHHVAMVSVLAPGEVIIKKDGYEVEIAVSSGVVEIRPTNEVYVVADTAERAEHIDLERAEAARKRAEDLMSQKEALADIEFARLQAKLEKELARLRVGRKYKKTPPFNS